ncbi:MAG TPA: pyridoxine 5'-phosphate synthase [Bacteriovoracaceae bacterium]|nr:pyridoxine 5'-phosphate synthase [Bacteriovoracaceae bacterium]
MKFARLGVNIDHVATLRQQRGEYYPEVFRAAEVALATGAHQITIHLREDRRHIQDRDVPMVHDACRKLGLPLNLEMGCTEEMIKIAINENPEWICLVPEKREERTTEGGLDVLGAANFENLKKTCEALKKGLPNSKISLFVESNTAVLKKCLSLKADAVEIHTGEYAKDFLNKQDISAHLQHYRDGHQIIKDHGWGYHAGHGLTFDSLEPLLAEGLFEEYNIGHWIIAESVFIGLGHVIKEMLALINRYPLKGQI